MLDEVNAYFERSVNNIIESSKTGDLSLVFKYLRHSARQLRLGALEVLIKDARDIVGPGALVSEPTVLHDELEPRCLHVTILECRKLKNMDLIGRNDVYVVLNVGNETKQTSIIHEGGAAPSWNGGNGESFVFTGGSEVPAGTVSVDVFDHDSNSADDIIGSARLPVVGKANEDSDWTTPATWFQLQTDNGARGEIYVSMQWKRPCCPSRACRRSPPAQ